MASTMLLALALAACATQPPAPLTIEERGFLGQLLLDPGLAGAIMRAVRQEYPSEAEEMTRRLMEIERSDRTDAEKRAAGAEVARALRLRHADGLLQASDANLRDYLASIKAVHDAVADDPAFCRKVGFKDSSDLSPDEKERKEALWAEMAGPLITAMAQGERAPVGRRVHKDASVVAAAKRLYADFSPAEKAAFKNKGTDAEVCSAYRRFYDRLLKDDQPGADSLRALTVWTMAQF